jgi:hypothetical protein
MTTTEEQVWSEGDQGGLPPGVYGRDSQGGVVYNPAEVEKQREKVRARLALSLLLLVAGMSILVVALVAIKRITVQEATDLFAVILPPLTGLLGAATGFYYAGRVQDGPP